MLESTLDQCRILEDVSWSPWHQVVRSFTSSRDHGHKAFKVEQLVHIKVMSLCHDKGLYWMSSVWYRVEQWTGIITIINSVFDLGGHEWRPFIIIANAKVHATSLITLPCTEIPWNNSNGPNMHSSIQLAVNFPERHHANYSRVMDFIFCVDNLYNPNITHVVLNISKYFNLIKCFIL